MTLLKLKLAACGGAVATRAVVISSSSRADLVRRLVGLGYVISSEEVRSVVKLLRVSWQNVKVITPRVLQVTWVNIFQIITLSYIVYLMENTKFNYDNASGCITSKATDSDMYPSCRSAHSCSLQLA